MHAIFSEMKRNTNINRNVRLEIQRRKCELTFVGLVAKQSFLRGGISFALSKDPGVAARRGADVEVKRDVRFQLELAERTRLENTGSFEARGFMQMAIQKSAESEKNPSCA